MYINNNNVINPLLSLYSDVFKYIMLIILLVILLWNNIQVIFWLLIYLDIILLNLTNFLKRINIKNI